MRKWLIGVEGASLLLWLFSTTGVYAQFGSTVEDTPHNLREATEGAMQGLQLRDYGEICVYCHTPHNSNPDIPVPMWNRNAPTGPYTMYSSPTIDMTIAGSPQGVSLACLSCHDNTIALDAIINVPSAYTGPSSSGNVKISACASACHVAPGPAGGLNFEGTNIGTDLSNDHPISITYDVTKDPKFHAPSNGKVGSLSLYGAGRDQVECASCHNPHDNSKRPFLRMSNEGSALCLTCHNL